MEAIKISKNYQFHILLNVLFSLIITLSSYVHTPLNNFKDYSIYSIHFILQQFCVFGFLYILSLNRFVFKIIFPILFITLSAIAFWAFSLDISFSDGIVQATMETKSDIALDLINVPFLFFILVSIIATWYILKIYNRIQFNLFDKKLFILSLIAISTFFIVEKKRNGTLKSRLPFNVYFEIKNYFSKNNTNFTKINQSVNCEVENLKIYLILGESVRADHLSLNGYNRNTTPLLSAQKNIISFPNIFTNKTYTAISLPQILSNESIYDSIDKIPKYALTDILNHANIKTSWVGNQTPEKSYNYFIQNSENKIIIDPLHSIYSFKKASDLELLKHINPSQKNKQNSLSIFHMIGSHWYYENRYSEQFKKFKPTIKSKYIPSNTKEEMINSYDNTIVALDYFLNNFIEELKKSNEKSLLLYVSDHGELLGENNKWLHAYNSNEKGLQNPAFIVWYSDHYNEEFSVEIQNIEKKQQQHKTLDMIYHSVLDIFKVENRYYNKKESLLN
ncbi:phosphoethanolamine transferase [Flavobacterium sp.]|uniref:phosphoethanolamine transferase n=1 Tax=Flavobacterium sp. TaxID=239 RepID=UPI004048253C